MRSRSRDFDGGGREEAIRVFGLWCGDGECECKGKDEDFCGLGKGWDCGWRDLSKWQIGLPLLPLYESMSKDKTQRQRTKPKCKDLLVITVDQ